MSDDKITQPAAAQTNEATAAAAAAGADKATSDSGAPTINTKPIEKESSSADDSTEVKEEATAIKSNQDPASSATEAVPTSQSTEQKPTDTDVEMADVADKSDADVKADTAKTAEPANIEDDKAAEDVAEGAGEGVAAENESATHGDKSKARRKSTADNKGKKLNKKASRAKILHVDAQPGEHYFAKLKGFPPWPVIIAEEDMLPQSMLSSRPVTAARPDGTYREDFADGGKRIADRTFPVMYLHTNEFSWTPNTELKELDPETVAGMVTSKMRKDLQNAHLLAAEQNDLDYYKNVLREFEEQRIAKLEAKKAKSTKTPKKGTKASDTAAADEDGDIEMGDFDATDEAEPVEKKPKSSKKRKADDDSNSTPQRSESVKKPKIKLTNSSTPKTANGVQSPTPKDSKPVKVKAKPAKGGKENADAKKEKESSVPVVKEAELSPEEKRMRKEKEILFLRHRLQKGLLVRDQEPKEEEMKSMSEFLAKLETFPDLEVNIIRVTKINKVLKAILKIDTIPKEEEFQFKQRSQTLLDKWTKLIQAAEDDAAAATSGANGVNGSSGEAAKGEKGGANGVKETSADVKADLEKEDAKPDALEDQQEKADTKTTSTSEEKADAAEAANVSADDVPTADADESTA